MSKHEYPLVHIYPRKATDGSVRIVATTSGLCVLINTLIDAIAPGGEGSAEVFFADADAFEVQVIREDSDEAWDTLELP